MRHGSSSRPGRRADVNLTTHDRRPGPRPAGAERLDR
jgi:hypothetical protein